MGSYISQMLCLKTQKAVQQMVLWIGATAALMKYLQIAEFILTKDRIRDGLKKLEQEAAKQEKLFRDAHQPEEAHRIATQVRELKEQLTEGISKVNLESYIRYFYEDTVSLPELLMSMTQKNS